MGTADAIASRSADEGGAPYGPLSTHPDKPASDCTHCRGGEGGMASAGLADGQLFHGLPARYNMIAGEGLQPFADATVLHMCGTLPAADMVQS